MKAAFLRPLFVALICFVTVQLHAQGDSEPPYKKSPDFPAIRLLLPDSVSYFTKSNLDPKKNVLVMLFNPQCGHCKQETEDMVKNIEKFKDIQVLMVTSLGFDSMKVFREHYGLTRFKNIVVTYDPEFTMISFFRVSQLPSLAFYDRKKKLIRVVEGGLPVDKIIREFE